jgi:hypothetical protein
MKNTERISLRECEAIAQEQGYDSITFDLCGGKNGKIPCKWEDAYLGVLLMKDKIVFVGEEFYKTIDSLNMWCEITN